jgi:hypothetical protein
MNISRLRLGRLGRMAALGIVPVLFGLLAWRSLSPDSRQLVGHHFDRVSVDGSAHAIPSSRSDYDDAVTVVTAHHFKQDGFWRTHLLPNRGGHPLVSFYDHTRTQCVSREQPRDLMMYREPSGRQVLARSNNNDCIYTHYPPLADWLFGAMAAVGFDELVHYRMLAIAANCLFLLLLLVWLRFDVKPLPAVAAVVVAATLPAFLRWKDALYYQPFQFLLLVAGLVAWRTFLQGPRRRHLVLTWMFFLLEALTSYELTLFFAIAIVGLWAMDPPDGIPRPRFRLILLQGLAPVSAFLIHHVLIVSYIGFGDTVANLQATLSDRVTRSLPQGSTWYFTGIDDGIFPLWGIPAACLVIWAVRRTAGLPCRNVFILLGTLCLGGLSFFLVFHGTATQHHWMMNRHLLPFGVQLVALLFDSIRPAIKLCREGRTRRTRLSALLCSIGACLLLAIVGRNNLRQVEAELAWIRMKNRHPQPSDDLARTALAAMAWREDLSWIHGYAGALVSGVGTPPGLTTGLRLTGPLASHLEIWWLEKIGVQDVRILIDSSDTTEARDHCVLSALDDRGFHPVDEIAASVLEPFAPPTGTPPPRQNGSWLRTTLPSPVGTRALRLTCAGHDAVAIRQIEVFSAVM